MFDYLVFTLYLHSYFGLLSLSRFFQERLLRNIKATSLLIYWKDPSERDDCEIGKWRGKILSENFPHNIRVTDVTDLEPVNQVIETISEMMKFQTRE
jgi:hypothetical protein